MKLKNKQDNNLIEFINKYIHKDKEVIKRIYRYILDSYKEGEIGVLVALKDNIQIKGNEKYLDLEYSNSFIRGINVSTTNKEIIGIRFYFKEQEEE